MLAPAFRITDYASVLRWQKVGNRSHENFVVTLKRSQTCTEKQKQAEEVQTARKDNYGDVFKSRNSRQMGLFREPSTDKNHFQWKLLSIYDAFV